MELERAAAQARTAARRLLEGEISRGHTHGLALPGNIKKAEDSLDKVARATADRSTA